MSDNPILNKILSEQKPDPEKAMKQQEGYIWFNMLIKYRLDGTSEIVRSFSKPAAESSIKGLVKKKPKAKVKLDFETDTKTEKTQSLF